MNSAIDGPFRETSEPRGRAIGIVELPVVIVLNELADLGARTST
jgi:hypothetical protein